MRIKLKYLLIAWVVVILLMLWALTAHGSLNSRVKLTGGNFGTKSYSLWELHQYKDTTMMRRSPLCWLPYRAYLAVWHHVKINSGENKNWIMIDTDLIDLLSEEAQFNKAFAKRFRVSGNRKHKVWTIYRWCFRIPYTSGKKYAYDAFTSHQADCAGKSAAFYVLCKAHKIPVRYVIGWTKGACHAWNRVKIGGKWYWIDCTYGYWLERTQFDGRTVMEMW